MASVTVDSAIESGQGLLTLGITSPFCLLYGVDGLYRGLKASNLSTCSYAF